MVLPLDPLFEVRKQSGSRSHRLQSLHGLTKSDFPQDIDMAKSPTPKKTVETLKHDEAKRRNIPTAEYQSVLQKEQQDPIGVQYHRDVTGLEEEKRSRDRDLDPQLVWRGKDEQDWSDLVVQAPPLFIQEKVHPKALIDDLLHQSEAARIAKTLASGVAGGIGGPSWGRATRTRRL